MGLCDCYLHMGELEKHEQISPVWTLAFLLMIAVGMYVG